MYMYLPDFLFYFFRGTKYVALFCHLNAGNFRTKGNQDLESRLPREDGEGGLCGAAIKYVLITSLE